MPTSANGQRGPLGRDLLHRGVVEQAVADRAVADEAGRRDEGRVGAQELGEVAEDALAAQRLIQRVLLSSMT